MYRLLCTLMTVLYCIQPTLAQKTTKSEQGFKHAFQIDILLHSKPELAFQYEIKLQKDVSILGSVGFKKHKLPDYISLSEYKNSYIFEKTKSMHWILLIPTSSDSERYLAGTLPLENVGSFIPESSVPVKFSVRKYFGDLKKRTLQGFWGFGLMASIHKGYTIRDKTKITDIQQREQTTGVPFIAGTLTTTTTTYFDQTRNISASKMATFGMNATVGLQKWVSERVSLSLAVEAGTNIQNANKDSAYYGLKPNYITIHSAISYSF